MITLSSKVNQLHHKDHAGCFAVPSINYHRTALTSTAGSASKCKLILSVKNTQTASDCSKQQGHRAKRKTNWRQCVTYWLINAARGRLKNKRPIVGGAGWGDMAHANAEDTQRLDSYDVTFDDVRHWITAFAMPFMAGHSASTSRCTHTAKAWPSISALLLSHIRVEFILCIYYTTHVWHCKDGISFWIVYLWNTITKTTNHHKTSPSKN